MIIFEKFFQKRYLSLAMFSNSRISMSLRFADYTSLEDFKSECRFDPYLLEDSLQSAHRPCNRHILEYVLSKGVKPTSASLYHAVRAGNMDLVKLFLELLKDEPNKKNILSGALHTIVVSGADEDIPGIELLIAHGAEPKNTTTSAAILCETPKIAKVLDAHGAVFQNEDVYTALRFGHFEAAYWLYQKGLRNIEEEVPYEFLQYKATRDAERDSAARKIYFWILPKLYRNPEFVMQQAEKSYNALFGQ